VSNQLIVRGEAEAELADAFAWYEARETGLGVDLINVVEVALAEIRRRPESFQRVHGEVRRALLKRFPYGVFFVADEGRITVIAVFHASRDPKVWQARGT